MLASRIVSSEACSTSGRVAQTWDVMAWGRQRAGPRQSRQHKQHSCQVRRATSQDAPTAEEQRRLSSLGGVVTDAAVPEGHKGLHGFLYGEGGAEEHDSKTYTVRHVSFTVRFDLTVCLCLAGGNCCKSLATCPLSSY